MSELLSKEQLAEIERWSKGPTTETWFNSAQQQVTALLAHCRALEAERDRLRLPIRAQATVETAMKQSVDDFRQRAIEAVRARKKYPRNNNLPYDDFTFTEIESTIQSLPAISEQKEDSGG